MAIEIWFGIFSGILSVLFVIMSIYIYMDKKEKISREKERNIGLILSISFFITGSSFFYVFKNNIGAVRDPLAIYIMTFLFIGLGVLNLIPAFGKIKR